MSEIIIKHVKSGGLYKVMGPAKIEATLEDVVVYMSLQDGKVWVRPMAEMVDGRFVDATPKDPA
jgi:hypothetical protein